MWIGLTAGTGVSTALGNVHRPKFLPTKPLPVGVEPRTVAVPIADILHQQVHNVNFTYLWRLFLLLRESDPEVMKRISGISKDV